MLAPTTAAHLSRVVLMVRAGEGFAHSLNFYSAGLGLAVHRATDDWAVLSLTLSSSSTTPTTTLCLQAVTSEAQLATGYSPLLQFHVHNLNQVVAQCIQLGGHLDGPIQYPAHGTMAALRTPDGHMIGLYEPATTGGGDGDGGGGE